MTSTTTNPASSSDALLIELDLDGTPRGRESVDTSTDDAGATAEMQVAAIASIPDFNDGNPISHAAVELIDAERTICQDFGFKHDDGALFFAPGTELYDIGVQNMLAQAKEYRALPTLADATAQHTATIAAEERKDPTVKLADWRIDDTGKLAKCGDPSTAVELTLTAWNHLTATHRTIRPSPNNSTELNQAKSAAMGAIHPNVNAWIGQTTVARQLRTRKLRGKPQGYAVVSPGYNRCDSHEVLALVRDAMGGGSDVKCDLRYDAASTRMVADIYTMSPVDVPGFPTGVGRVHTVGIQISTGDTGIDTISGNAYVKRAACRNYTLIQESRGHFSYKHKGEPERIVNAVRQIVGDMPKMIDEIRTLWMRAALECYTDSQSGDALTIPETLERLVRLQLIPIGDLSQDDAIAALVAAHEEERDISNAAGVLSAVTRAAGTTWRTKWNDDATADELEVKASEALYQHVYVLDRPDFVRSELELS